MLSLLGMNTDNFIVNVSGMGGLSACAGLSVYDDCKEALQMFKES